MPVAVPSRGRLRSSLRPKGAPLASRTSVATLRLLLLVAILTLLLGVASLTEIAGASDKVELDARPNIVVVILDTVRRDALGCYGNPMGLTPHLDGFADSSFVFEQARSHAPWTLPSIASLLTSRAPGEHGAAGALGEFTKLAGDRVTLPEVLRGVGYHTAAITNVMFLGTQFGLHQGFEHLDAYEPKDNFLMRRAVSTTEAALRHLDRRTDGTCSDQART